MDRCLIIAEAGVNHNGDVNLAYRLCDAAKEAGADVVKFQTWKTEKLLTVNVEQADYQRENTKKEESQFEMLKKLELSYEDFSNIKKHCDEIGIQFASTADEEESLDFLVSIGIPFIKIGSGEIGNIPYLRYMGAKKLPIIMSTGMSTLEDVRESLEALKSGGAEDITVLHCTTNYPCDFGNVNLRAMETLRNAFHLPVGYSDHTQGSIVPVSAVAMGATVIEKHFTLDKEMEGPDHKASASPEEFKSMVGDIRNLEKALGTGEKIPMDSEKEIAKVVQKRIVAREAISAGEIFSEKNVCVMRHNSGALAKEWDRIIGETAVRDYVRGEGIPSC